MARHTAPMRQLVASFVACSTAILSSTAIAANSLDAADGSPTNAVYVDNDGKVGIGTTTIVAKAKLQTVGDILSTNANGGEFFMAAKDGAMDIASGNDSISYIDFRGNSNLAEDWVGRILFDDTKGFAINTRAGAPLRVGIGTWNPQSTLAVNGKISAKEIEVTLTGFPDYVFSPEYSLMPLNDVKSYIEEKGHLPGMPTAEDVAANGLNLGTNQVKLLEKIEELTLHLISMREQLDEQQKTIDILRAPN